MSHFREQRAGTGIRGGHSAALDRPVVVGRRMPRVTKAAGATQESAELRRSQRGAHAGPTGRFPSHRALPHAQEAALGAIANVLIMHLEEERERSTHASAPVLIQVDGPGGTDLVEMVADSLRAPPAEGERGNETGDLAPPAIAGDQPARRSPHSPWNVIRFDAWQYQRVAPPWWWLITALDRQLRAEFRKRGAAVLRRKRLADYRWRLGQFFKDLVPVLPLVFAALALWFMTGELGMGKFLTWFAGVIGGLTTLVAVLWSATNVVRRLLLASPANVQASTMRTSDPMADLQLRYSFLVRSADRPIVLVIDNLDRCRAEYVVELLEGIQTLLKNPESGSDPARLVAVLVPAARGWLCESYLQVYHDFQGAMRQPGRPFGLAFVDRVFDLALRLPRIPPAPAIDEGGAVLQKVCHQIHAAPSEREIRKLVAGAESRRADGSPVFEPVLKLRLEAVRRLGELDSDSGERLCLGATRDLTELLNAVAPGPTVAKQLRTAYCVQRTAQLLGGHPLDDDPDAVHRLGLWTILNLRWPLLCEHLACYPDHVRLLQRQQSPTGVCDDLEQVFTDPEAARLTIGWPGAEIGPENVRRFSSAPRKYGPLPQG
jgi:KAP-like P-loop domain-containing protein